MLAALCSGGWWSEELVCLSNLASWVYAAAGSPTASEVNVSVPPPICFDHVSLTLCSAFGVTSGPNSIEQSHIALAGFPREYGDALTRSAPIGPASRKAWHRRACSFRSGAASYFPRRPVRARLARRPALPLVTSSYLGGPSLVLSYVTDSLTQVRPLSTSLRMSA